MSKLTKNIINYLLAQYSPCSVEALRFTFHPLNASKMAPSFALIRGSQGLYYAMEFVWLDKQTIFPEKPSSFCLIGPFPKNRPKNSWAELVGRFPKRTTSRQSSGLFRGRFRPGTGTLGDGSGLGRSGWVQMSGRRVVPGDLSAGSVAKGPRKTHMHGI